MLRISSSLVSTEYVGAQEITKNVELLVKKIVYLITLVNTNIR